MSQWSMKYTHFWQLCDGLSRRRSASSFQSSQILLYSEQEWGRKTLKGWDLVKTRKGRYREVGILVVDRCYRWMTLGILLKETKRKKTVEKWKWKKGSKEGKWIERYSAQSRKTLWQTGCGSSCLSNPSILFATYTTEQCTSIHANTLLKFSQMLRPAIISLVPWSCHVCECALSTLDDFKSLPRKRAMWYWRGSEISPGRPMTLLRHEVTVLCSPKCP